MNVITIVGRLGQDPEIKTTTSGKQVATFSVAVKRIGSETDWFNVECWDKRAEFVANYATKGRDVAVTGRMESRKVEGKGTFWTLKADNISLIGGVKEKDENDPFA